MLLGELSTGTSVRFKFSNAAAQQCVQPDACKLRLRVPSSAFAAAALTESLDRLGRSWPTISEAYSMPHSSFSSWLRRSKLRFSWCSASVGPNIRRDLYVSARIALRRTSLPEVPSWWSTIDVVGKRRILTVRSAGRNAPNCNGYFVVLCAPISNNGRRCCRQFCIHSPHSVNTMGTRLVPRQSTG